MADSLEKNLFVRVASLLLEVAPKPLRELFRDRWDARYPADKARRGRFARGACSVRESFNGRQ